MGKHSGKPLYEVPEKDLYVGMPLISARGTPGKIIKICFEPEATVDILWENGNRTEKAFAMWNWASKRHTTVA